MTEHYFNIKVSKNSWFLNSLLITYVQELHLHGNSIGDEGVRALMSGLSMHKGVLSTISSDIFIIIFLCIFSCTSMYST